MYPQSMFAAKNKKNINIFLLKFFNFYKLKIYISHGQVFVMYLQLIQDILRCDGSFLARLYEGTGRVIAVTPASVSAFAFLFAFASALL